jgi:hypothetical protein
VGEMGVFKEGFRVLLTSLREREGLKRVELESLEELENWEEETITIIKRREGNKGLIWICDERK